MAIPEKYSHIKFVPPSGVRREAEYGLKLRREHGRGGTAVGIARARDLSNGKEVSPSTVRRMKAFFDRHASDAKAEGFTPGDKGFPSNGKIANLLWGGPSGYSWAKKVVEQMNAADEKSRSYSPDTETRSLEVKETGMQNVERRYLAASGSENSTEGTLGVEHRADPQTGEKRTYLIGYAAKFNTDSLLLGDFVERIAPSAFEIVEKGEDLEGKPLETRGLFNHDPNHLIGRFPNTMKLTVDKIGLKYEIMLPESRKDLAESVARGDLKGSSFSFVVAEGGEKWTREGGKSRRLVTKIKSLLDCGPVTYPAYRDSSVAVAKRSYEQFAAVADVPKVDFKEEMRKLREFYAERRGFCPTGPGGGIDNSCGSGGKSGGSDKMDAAKKAKEDYDKAVATPKGGALAGAAVGAALGSVGGIPGIIVGSLTGAAFGAIGAVVAGGRLEKLSKGMGVSGKQLSTAGSHLFGKEVKPFSIDGKTIGIDSGDSVAMITDKSPFTQAKGTSLHYQPGADINGKLNVASVEKAAKAVGAKTVSVEAFHDEDVKTLEAKGYKQIASSPGGYSTSKGVYERKLGKSKRSFEMLVAEYAKSMEFFQSRGFCPTGPGGGIDNSCGKGGDGPGKDDDSLPGGSGTGPIMPKSGVFEKYGKPTKGLDVEKVTGKSDSIMPKSTIGEKYGKSSKGIDPEKIKSSGGKVDGQLAGYKVQPKMGADSGKYMEWKKGKDKEAQGFIDKARKEQLSKGGKDKGKADEGGGVQTWSKGDHFPWTTKQVGDKDGYLQGVHPDGSKTEKYPFKDGNTSEAEKMLGEELKRRPGKRAYDPRQVVEDTLRFLKDRR